MRESRGMFPAAGPGRKILLGLVTLAAAAIAVVLLLPSSGSTQAARGLAPAATRTPASSEVLNNDDRVTAGTDRAR